MKKSFYIITAAALSLVACSRNQEVDVPDANLSIFARTESPADTKSVVESGVHVYWEPGDEIAVFMGEKSAKFTTDITAASGTATFKGTFGDATWPEDLDLWAVYPYSEDAVFDGETITTTLPSEQVAREGSFGKDMNLAIAHSSGTTLQFYNVGGGIRFSVTEEGIKKVMFEGLSGEIISGKVKIGFEDGLPVVQEVTGGSQFITLLPPSGQETFEPGAWYYIVAIPGALEGGYKLRFYKDSDYARKVSEKKVEIKRSIFGNIEKADNGIEYEASTTHFPETDEEWEKSISSTNMIVKEWDKMVAKTISLENSSSVDPTSLASQITNIEGVSDVDIKGSTIVITQSDGIILNLLLDAYNWRNYMVDEENTPSYSPKSILSASKQFRTSKITSPPTGGSVLVLSPAAFDSPILPEKLSEYEDIFKDIGFQNVNIDPVASIGMFYGKKLAEYDVVIFSTHGGIGTFNTVDGKGITSTIICSGTPYDESNKEVYMKRNPALAVVPKNLGQQIKQAINENVTNIGEVESITYLCMTPYFLDELDENAFNNCWIHFESCHTADYDSNGQRPMMQAFVDKGVSLVTGFYDSVSWPAVMYPMTYQLIKDMSLGLSFDNAYNRRNAVFRDCCDGYEIGDPFFLVNPYPTNLHNSEINDCRTTLIWDQAKTRGDYRFKVYLKWPNSNSYSTYNSTTSKAYTTDVLQPGEYFWYVEANLYYDGKVIESFISDTKSFTVTEEIHYETPEAIDLGLSVKWASFNLGATKKEDYGYYFAWGETEPKDYYYWDSYKWCEGSYNTLTKYSVNSAEGYNGFVDDRRILEKNDDAAYVNLGDKWRMPTQDEWEELLDNCTLTWTTEYGEVGYKAISKKNGNYVFFPVGGFYYRSSTIGLGSRGNYWASDLRGVIPEVSSSWAVDSFNMGEDKAIIGGMARYYGETIRPVSPKPAEHVILESTDMIAFLGDPCVLFVSTIPENSSHSYICSSSDESVASIALVTKGMCFLDCHSPGVTTVTVSAYDGGAKATCRVTVKGTPMISASPTSLDYGDVKVGTALGNEAGRVTFTNTGSADLSISSIDCPDGFSHSPSLSFPIVISPGNDKTITFAFKPTEVKTYSGQIEIYSDAWNEYPLYVDVTGNGIK